MALHYPSDEFKSLLLHENDFDPDVSWSKGERRGTQLSSGVAQMLQLWPALLSNILRTFVLVLVACFVFVLAILTLVFSTNFSLISPSSPLHPLHLQTRSIHDALLPDLAESTQCRAHTETIYRYIVTGSEETVNLFYVIDQDSQLTTFAKKLLKFYVLAGYKVFLVRVCRTKFVEGEEIEKGVYRKGNFPLRDENFPAGNLVERNEIAKDALKKAHMKRSISMGHGNQNGTILLGKENGLKQLVMDVKVPSSTADIETYDARMRKEIASGFGQSREFFDRLRKVMYNRTFEEDDKSVEKIKPLTSLEINVTETDDELKKVQICTCPGCGHAKTRGAAIFGPDARDLVRVELLNVNYQEFLRGSIFETRLLGLNGNHALNDGQLRESVGSVDENDGESNFKKSSDVTDKLEVRSLGSARIDAGGRNYYDLNLVKLLLLWKFGNSLVLLDDQAAVIHSRLLDKQKVNLGFHLIYSPYECASVIYNLMQEYEREGNMRRTIGKVYKAFCKKAPRGVCNAIRYVSVKRK